jgi:hypothetical protein
MKRKISYVISAIALLLGAIVYGSVWNEARKEVYYLCGNFSAGTAYKEVIRQLDTATLAEYSVFDSPDYQIVFSNPLFPPWKQCVIDIQHTASQPIEDAIVAKAQYQ